LENNSSEKIENGFEMLHLPSGIITPFSQGEPFAVNILQSPLGTFHM